MLNVEAKDIKLIGIYLGYYNEGIYIETKNHYYEDFNYILLYSTQQNQLLSGMENFGNTMMLGLFLLVQKELIDLNKFKMQEILILLIFPQNL
jgi:hypothetical protein